MEENGGRKKVSMIFDTRKFELIDISMKIKPVMPVYKGRKEKLPRFTTEADFTNATIYESRVDLNLHTGTHLDSAHHMMPEGEWIDSVRLEELFVPCSVIDCSEVESEITMEHLKKHEIHAGEFVLLKTRNSFEDILEKDFVFLEKSGAAYLKDKNIIGVGTDGLGIERSQPGHETHLTLMEQGIHILEGLRLSHVQAGEYILIAFPLFIANVEAAPVRAVLLKAK